MADLDKSKAMLPQLEAFDSAGTNIANGSVSSEYDEYLRLKQAFVGPKLQKLVRKIEYVDQCFCITSGAVLSRTQSSCPSPARSYLSSVLHRPWQRWYVLAQRVYITKLTSQGNAKLFHALADLSISGQEWNTALAVSRIPSGKRSPSSRS